jgi:hypothetical protein
MVHFQTKNSDLGKFWKMEKVGIYGHLEYIRAIRYISVVSTWKFSFNLVHFPPFGILRQEKSGNLAPGGVGLVEEEEDCDGGAALLRQHGQLHGQIHRLE